MSDTGKLIGKIIEGPAEKDAIHVAVAPVHAAFELYPGQHIGINTDGNAIPAELREGIGIADPFLKTKILPGDRFWLFLYPGSITSLRHQWSHPAFDEATEPAVAPQESSLISHADHVFKSNKWIEDEAEHLDITVNQLMSSAQQWLFDEHYTVQHDSEHWRDSFRSKEFWHHYEVVTGTVVPEEKKHSFFCCTC